MHAMSAAFMPRPRDADWMPIGCRLDVDGCSTPRHGMGAEYDAPTHTLTQVHTHAPSPQSNSQHDVLLSPAPSRTLPSPSLPPPLPSLTSHFLSLSSPFLSIRRTF